MTNQSILPGRRQEYKFHHSFHCAVIAIWYMVIIGTGKFLAFIIRYEVCYKYA